MNVIKRVINELKHESEYNDGLGGSSMSGFGGMMGSSFGGINDESANNGLGGINNQDDGALSDTLKQLQFLWERNF